MKKLLSIVILSALLASGCGGNDQDFASSPSGSVNTQARTVIPSTGGEVAIPSGTGFDGSLVFDPGAAEGTEITIRPSLEAPTGATLPLVGLNSPHASSQDFFYLTFSVSQPTPLALLEAVRLRGAIPTDQEKYDADLYQIGSSSRAQAGEGSQSTLLQQIPGEVIGSEAVFDEVVEGATLQPGVDYALRFKGTDQKTLEMTVVNNSGITPAYVFIRGENPDLSANDRRFYRVNAEGALAPMDLDDLVDGYADYNIEVPADGKIRVPLVASGRLYISLGEKIKTQLNPPVQPTDPPALWVAPNGWSNTADPNFRTLWDWVEFDYKISPDSNLPGMGINTTQVQMMGIPTTLTLTGPTTGTQTSGAKTEGTRTSILDALAADSVFKTLIIDGTATGTNIRPIRAVSADNGISNVRNNVAGVPTFSTTFFDDYIDQVWDKYRTEDLAMETSAWGTFLGRVNAQDQMVFVQAGRRSVVIPKPGTSDVIIGDGLLLFDVANATTDEEKAIVREHASAMSACFNRSTLLTVPRMLRNPVPGSFDPATFYQAVVTNFYSKLNHEHSLPTVQAPLGGAYGFGYDDNLNQSSFIADNRAPTSLVVTIPKF